MHSRYQREICQTLREKELRCRVRFFYQSPQMVYRQQSMMILSALSERLDLGDPATHLAALLVDRFMDHHHISPNRLDLLVAVCVLVATKVELTDAKIPYVSQLRALLRGRHPTSEFVQLERVLVKFFDWSLMLPTAAHFAELLLPAAVSSFDVGRQDPDPRRLPQLHAECQDLVSRYLKVTLLEVHTHDYLPSLVAASCFLAARSTLRLRDVWPRRLVRKTGYTHSEVRGCLNAIMPHPRKRRCVISGSPDGGYESGVDIERSPNGKRINRAMSPAV